MNVHHEKQKKINHHQFPDVICFLTSCTEHSFMEPVLLQWNPWWTTSKTGLEGVP